jgi:hypothetical protein
MHVKALRWCQAIDGLGGSMKKTGDRAAETPLRFRAARGDSSIGTLRSEIEEIFDLPSGCIRIVGPDGRTKRQNATVRSLR